MAGRIRSIKPELLEDERVAFLSHKAFRLFVGCLLLADDYGNLRWVTRWLHGQIFWAQDMTPAEVEAAQVELIGTEVGKGLLRPYEVNGQWYAHVGGWEKHQKIDHPGKPRAPSPQNSNGFALIPTVSRDSREGLSNIPETLAPDQDQDHDQDQDQEEERGEGESATPPDESDDSPDSDSDDSSNAANAPVRLVWDSYVAGWQSTIGKGRVPVLTSKRRNQIRARLKNYSVNDLTRASAALWSSSWHVEKGQTAPELVFRADERIEWWLSRMECASPLSEPEPPMPPDCPMFPLDAVPSPSSGQQRALLDKSTLSRRIV